MTLMLSALTPRKRLWRRWSRWRPIGCLLDADARHRERHRLAELPPERLRDMGLPERARQPHWPADRFAPDHGRPNRRPAETDRQGWDAPLWWWR